MVILANIFKCLTRIIAAAGVLLLHDITLLTSIEAKGGIRARFNAAAAKPRASVKPNQVRSLRSKFTRASNPMGGRTIPKGKLRNSFRQATGQMTASRAYSASKRIRNTGLTNVSRSPATRSAIGRPSARTSATRSSLTAGRVNQVRNSLGHIKMRNMNRNPQMRSAVRRLNQRTAQVGRMIRPSGGRSRGSGSGVYQHAPTPKLQLQYKGPGARAVDRATFNLRQNRVRSSLRNPRNNPSH